MDRNSAAHVYAATNLHTLTPGMGVNLEVDVLAKYAESRARASREAGADGGVSAGERVLKCGAGGRQPTQQMRGSCSPNMTSSTRVPPISVFIRTMPGWSATTSPMMAASLAERMRAHLREDSFGHVGADDGEQLAFVGDVERIEAEHLAGAADGFAHGDGLLAQQHADVGALGDLVERGGRAAARGVAQAMEEVGPAADGVASIAATRVLSEAQSLSIAPSNSRPSRCDMMAMPWSPR